MWKLLGRQLELAEADDGVLEHFDARNQLLQTDVLVAAVDALAAVAHVGRGDVGVLDVEHAAVRATTDHVLGGLDAELGVRFEQRHQQVAPRVDAVEVVDRGQLVAGDLDRTAEFGCSTAGLLQGHGHHLLGLVQVETAGGHVDDRLGGVALDVGHVEE